MLAPIGPTMDTTFALQIEGSDGDFHFTSQAEYTDAQDCRDQVATMYGGAFAGRDKHRIVVITRTVLPA